MTDNYLSNPSGLINQYLRNEEFQGFSLELDEDRYDEDFEKLFTSGKISVEINELKESVFDTLKEVPEIFRGEKVGIFAKGKKLIEGTFTNESGLDVNNNTSLNFSFPHETGYNTDFEDVFPNLERSVPEGVNSLEDLATALDIRKLSFKPVSKTSVSTQPSSNNKSVGSQSSNMIENVMQMVKQNKMILAGAGIVAILVIE